MKLGKQQQRIVDELKNDSEKYIQHVHDYRDMTYSISLSDEGNDYENISHRMLCSLFQKNLLVQFDEMKSLEVEVYKYKLTPQNK